MMKNCIRKIIICALLISAFSFNTQIVKAEPETKTVQVPINKNYKSAKFKMTFDYFEDYNVKVVSPHKKEFTCNLVGENIVESIVEDVEPGQWSVIISKPEETEEGTQGTETAEPPAATGEEGAFSIDEDVESEPLPISPVKIEVQGSTERIIDVNKDISVSTDIAGLKMYFKDDSYVAEWTDTTCGDVDIQVVNAKSLQNIDKQTVKDNYYECPLTADITEIMVKIVPSVSARIEGAENNYTLKFNNHPDATIEFEDLTITNHDTIIATCTLNKDYALQIMVNDKQVQKTDVLEKGVHEIEVPIDVGVNDIKIYVIDENGNMRSTSYSVEKDVVAPKLELVSSYEDIVTEDEYLTIEGRVEDYDNLMINNAVIDVEGDNTFKFDYKLKEGLNQIAVVASDIAGNETIYDIAAERIIPKDEPIPWVRIIIIAALVGLVTIYIIEVLRRKNDPKRYEKKRTQAEENWSEYDDIDISGMSKQEKKELLRGPGIVWDILSFIVPIATAYIIFTFIVFLSVVQSGSMEPTLRVGNTVFYNRLAYIKKPPQRGDIVVFYSDEFGVYFGKRIIGVPGDNISFKDGYVMINGQYCDETAYIPQSIETNCVKTFTVPEGCYFMLGDNREDSNDSRYWENPYIPFEKINGKYMGQIDFSIQYDILGNK